MWSPTTISDSFLSRDMNIFARFVFRQYEFKSAYLLQLFHFVRIIEMSRHVFIAWVLWRDNTNLLSNDRFCILHSIEVSLMELQFWIVECSMIPRNKGIQLHLCNLHRFLFCIKIVDNLKTKKLIQTITTQNGHPPTQTQMRTHTDKQKQWHRYKHTCV